MVADTHEAVAQRLARSRQRYTSGRRDLVALLARAGRPVTIPEILDLAPELPQSSVYRNLQVLEQAGAVRRVVAPNDAAARYELAEALTDHHHHLICGDCGTVEDVRLPPTVERALERLASQLDTAEGFRTDHHRLDLVGTCADCA